MVHVIYGHNHTTFIHQIVLWLKRTSNCTYEGGSVVLELLPWRSASSWFVKFRIAESTAFLYESAAIPLENIFPLEWTRRGKYISGKNGYTLTDNRNYGTEQSAEQQKQKNGKRNRVSPAIIYVVWHIRVVREACSKAIFSDEFPNWIGLFAANSDNPTSSEFDGHTAEVFLPNPTANTVWSLQDYKILYAILGQQLCRRDTFQKGKLIVIDMEKWRCGERGRIVAMVVFTGYTSTDDNDEWKRRVEEYGRERKRGINI